MADRLFDFDQISADNTNSSDSMFDVGMRSRDAAATPELFKGRDSSKSIYDRRERYYKQYENDIFLIHNPEIDRSSAISIRQSSIGMHVADGNIGIVINSNGDIDIQGRLVFKTSGENIIKGIFTENPLSFWPSDAATPVPGYLFKMPNIELINKIKELFDNFTKLFSGGPAVGNPLP